ncbi:DEAD/DEAH box helicase family protein [archaeon]|jgi:superfamily II DNA or RNA helicase/uncharacterized protein YndB with AHSA1/START domain|nr:DEAD/DEAH box helicase family protein [archaeon]MBT6698016.1 DEAD/DEAH box helicase family protein [archaeon]
MPNSKKKQSLAEANPSLAKQWHSTKNDDLTPKDVTPGSSKKVWWQCSKGKDHEWQATIKSRSNGNGCSVCRGRTVVKSNCLATTDPKLAKQWHPTKNGDLTPKDIIAGTEKKVWWKCPKGKDHEWIASVVNRKKGRGCAVCKGNVVVESNCLSTTHPDIAKQWHPTKNGGLTPKNVTAGSNKKVWWKCPKGKDHEWKTSVAAKKGCSICMGRTVVKSSCLAKTHPKISKEWHPTKNGTLTPSDVHAGSNKKVWWKCTKGKNHEWECKVSNRTSREYGCAICSNHKVTDSNSLAQTHPELAKEWHPTKNGSQKPTNFKSGSNKKVWWKCPKGKDHEWQAIIQSRAKGGGCGICSGYVVAESTSLAKKNSTVAKDWHPTKNGDLTPSDVYYQSSKKVWWKCPKGKDHEWFSPIVNRTKRGTGCNVCVGHKVVSSNSLFNLKPELAKEWHPTKNGKLTAKEVTVNAPRKVWWQCSKDKQHSWETSISKRSGRGDTCPYCSQRWSIENIRYFVKSIKDNIDSLTPAELYILFQQNGLLSTYSKSKPFIEALKTGKFPKEELEKFSNGEPSLVDDIINDTSIKLNDHINLDTNVGKHEVTDDELNEDIKEKELPSVQTKDILEALNNSIFSTADQEAIEYFITSGCSKVWKHAFRDEKEALKQAKAFKEGKFPLMVKKRFMEEYEGAKNLKMPKGYNFRIAGKKITPNLMQKLVAYRVLKHKRQGNWSGTGAGKTLSAIIASRVINSKLTIVTCPNSVVEGWEKNIPLAFPDSKVFSKTLKPELDLSKHNYLILNYEKFQQPNSEKLVRELFEKYKIDFIVIDEIHYSKQRVVEKMSKRRKLISALISNSGEKNINLHVLGLSATPVINNLQEGISLLELIHGVKFDDLNNKATVANCISLYQKLSSVGIRWLPDYKQELNEIIIPVNCDEYVGEIRKLGPKSTMLDLEKVLTKARINVIKENIRPKTIVYTQYVQDIAKYLKDEIEKDTEWKVGFYTGQDKTGKEGFLNGDVDVLIASSSIATGVDGLQHVSNRLIINVLPWTNAEFIQLKGRIYRQGQKKSHVDIIIPLSSATVSGETWSWCESKWKRIQFKKSIADASVDGIIPEGHLRSPSQAYKDAMDWLKRLEEGKVHKIERKKIHIPLSDSVITQQMRKWGEFSDMNRLFNTSLSATTHKRLNKDPAEWKQYHALYRKAREDWTTIPFKEMIGWCKVRPNFVVGDFGCGEAKIAESLDNTVHSFDHVAINDQVIAGDMSNVPLDGESLDVAIFSLSLMGKNFTDYLKEAHRCLKLDGHLHIIEATSRFSNIEEFTKGLEKLGFDIVKVNEKYKFTFIRAIKTERKLNDVKLKF